MQSQSVMTNTNQEIYLLYPRLNDYIFKSKRATQILYPKDMAIIASWTDLSHGKKVVEAGTGSGSLSCFIANVIRPDWHLYSYDIREESHETAKKNIEKAGLSEFITLKRIPYFPNSRAYCFIKKSVLVLAKP